MKEEINKQYKMMRQKEEQNKRVEKLAKETILNKMGEFFILLL